MGTYLIEHHTRGAKPKLLFQLFGTRADARRTRDAWRQKLKDEGGVVHERWICPAPVETAG